jgi:membrane fusion protein, multidrug efflux system
MPAGAGTPTAEAHESSRSRQSDVPDHPAHDAEPPVTRASGTTQLQAQSSHRGRRWLFIHGVLASLVGAGYFMYPTVKLLLNTVSTDDAYVNSHVTFVAPRVAGQVAAVLVDDNYRVKKGALLVQLDKEPFEVQVAIKQAAVRSAEADLTAAKAQVQSIAAQARANRFQLQHAIEDVNTQIAKLRANVATLNSKTATLERARADLNRAEVLFARHAVSREEIDQRREAEHVAAALAQQALEQVFETRVALGLPPRPEKGELSDVPSDLDQTFSAVRQALGQLRQSAAQFGYAPSTWNATPKQTLEEFYKQDPEGNIDRILARMLPNAPAIKQAEAKLVQARADLNEALLNRRYCDIVAEIDGVVTRRNVNPGNNVSVGQSLMAVRSLTEIWIDANFKETQLADLRIGHRVRCEVDMYGGRREFEGRITGFTMGTGQTLALLPAQNATGNFVKIVQRLPVRIELTDYDPDKIPLFVGLSVVPYVYYKEPPTGPHAGDVLQPTATHSPRPNMPSPPNHSESDTPIARDLEK